MYLDVLKARVAEQRLVNPKVLLPCKEEEISSIEQYFSISLPTAYKEFLLWMGHGAGGLMQGSDCFFRHLPYLREWAVELLQENNFSECLPDDAFVFFMHQGYQFSFFRTSEGEDPPTYFYCEGTNQNSFIKTHNRFSDFLATEIEIHAQSVMNFGKIE